MLAAAKVLDTAAGQRAAEDGLQADAWTTDRGRIGEGRRTNNVYGRDSVAARKTRPRSDPPGINDRGLAVAVVCLQGVAAGGGGGIGLSGRQASLFVMRDESM